MDRNQIIGIVLISAMLMVYMIFNREEELPKKPVDLQTTEQSDSTKTSTADVSSDSLTVDSTTTVEITGDSTSLEKANEELKMAYGVFAPYAKKEGKEIILENEDVKIVFDSKGANPVDVKLKKYTVWNGIDSNNVHLMDRKSNSFKHIVKTKNNQEITLEDLTFEVKGKGGFVKKGDSATVSFKIPVKRGYIEKSYTLKGSGYQLDYDIKFDRLENELNNKNLILVWEDNLKRTELGVQEGQRSWVNYYTTDGDFDDLLNDTEMIEKTKWMSYKQRFFNTGLIADNSFRCVNFEFKSFDQADTVPYVLGIKSRIEFPIKDITGNRGNYKFYFGPNDYQICKAVAPKYKENVYMGWKLFGWINEWLVRPIFNVCAYLGLSYGLIILLTVIIIKTLLFPIAFKSYKSMAKMKVLKPWIEDIKAKNKGNSQAIQMEQMKLYKQVGANPISGCIPQLLQIPIFLSLFNFFPNWIQLRHEGFLWAHDLSTYDAPFAWDTPLPIIGDHISLFTLLMTLSTLAYTYYNNQINSTSGPMKNIGYFMPIMFFFVLNSFAAALTYYYFLNTMITIIQQNLAMRFIDKDKIKDAMEENRRTAKTSGDGGGKKSKFMQRLEDAQKIAEEKRKAKKKK